MKKESINNCLRNYTSRFWFIPPDIIQRVIETLIWSNVSIQKPILEIGSGDGDISSLVFSNFGEIDVGIDLDSHAINRAKKCRLYKEVRCMDCANLKLKNNSFKMVVANSTFEHIENIGKSLSEVYKIMHNDGVFIFSVPMKKFEDEIIKRGGLSSCLKINSRLNHVNYFSKKEWLNLLSKVGFKKFKTQTYFSEEIFKLWYRLFLIFTFKIGNTEVWSLFKKYISGSRIIKNIIRLVLLNYLTKVLINKENKGKKIMVFIHAYKI